MSPRSNHGLPFVALAFVGPLLFAVVLIWRVQRLEDTPPMDVATSLNAR